MFRRWLLSAALVAGSLSGPALTPAQAETRVKVTGEVVDTWCTVTAIMFAYGTAHHQCAVWCAIGGIPVSIKDADGNFYMVLRIDDDDSNVANPRIVTIQSHQVSVDGELIERDGVKYLLVSQVADDKGVINLTHDDNGVVPFGN